MPADQRVPGYLGRVLDADGAAVGTCFQVTPEVLITVWHVLNDLNAADEGATVAVDALDGASGSAPAKVLRVDPVHDLAVLRRAGPLNASVSGVSATDVVAFAHRGHGDRSIESGRPRARVPVPGRLGSLGRWHHPG